MTDAAIISQIKEGNSKGYSMLVKRHKSRLYYFINGMVWNTMDAEDLTMITFEKAFLKLDTWKEGSCKFSTWLFTIAKNTVIDFRIAQQIRFSGGEDISKYRNIKDTSYTPYQELLQKELQALAEGRINKLPKKSKPVMQLHVIGYSDEEIAEKLSMIHGNVRCILSRAKKKLEPLKRLLYEKDYSTDYCLIA